MFAGLVREAAAQVARTGTFPWPKHFDRWSDEAVEDFVGKVFAKRGKGFALKILEKATSQKSLELLIVKTVRNVLIDEAKATETGKLRRRLKNVLPDDPSKRFEFFKQPFHAWGLVGAPSEVWQGDQAELLQAAAGVPGTLERLNQGGPTPLRIKKVLWAACAAVLDAAKARVEAQLLATVLRLRFIHISPLDLTSLEDLRADDEPATDPSAAPDVEALRSITVAEVWVALSPLEQQVFHLAGDPPHEWGPQFGLRKHAAELVAARALEKVRLAVLDDPDGQQIAMDVRGRSLETNLKSQESRRLSSTDPESSRRGESDA